MITKSLPEQLSRVKEVSHKGLNMLLNPENQKKYRRLTPLELERLNMFPDNHTLHENTTNSKRAFLMGNALVIGVVEEIGKSLYKQHYKYEKKG